MHLRNLLPIFMLFAFCMVDRGPATAQPSEAARPWSAQWITLPGLAGRAPAVVHFRKIVELPAKPEHFIVHVSADNAFLLHVNQQRVGSGPSRGDLEHWRYETYDLAPFLQAGSNVVAATVWNFGENAGAAQISDRLGFVMQGAGSAETALDTNERWDVEREEGIAAVPTPWNFLPNSYYAAEPIERLNGSAFDWSWDAPASGPRSHWTKARSEGNATLRGSELILNNWQLIADPLPAMEYKLLPAGRIVRTRDVSGVDQLPGRLLVVPPHSHASVLIDNGELTTAYPELTARGSSDALIRVTYAEALRDAKGEKGNRNDIEGKEISGVYDEFLTDGEPRAFSPLVWRTWRYLQIDVTTNDQTVEITRFRSWFTAFPFEERAKFTADDAELSAIWSISWRTARLDAHDTYMDTPYWEQLQYIGDTRIQALISYTVAGDDRLAREAIAAFDDSRIPDGITLSRYPTSLFQAIPTFSLLWVGMLKDFALYRDDADFVRKHLPGTRATLDWFLAHQNSNGLLGKLPWWAFVDWTDGFPFGVPPQTATGDSSPITLQFIAGLRDAAQLETTYGDPIRAALYQDAASRASKAVRRLCWDERLELIADTPEHQHYSQEANTLAVWLDVIPHDQQKEVLTRVLAASDSSFIKTDAHLPPMSKASYYFRFYLARALDHVGMADRYLDLLQPWRVMVGLGLTTWAEVPEPTRSDSHAWSAHPNYDLLTLVAGIRPSTFGFKSVTIEPHLGELKRVSASFPHLAGEIQTNYRVRDKNVAAHIVLPSGLTGKLIWKGRDYPLHEGSQDLTLSQ